MWWHCEYRAHPGVRASDLARCFLRQHDGGTNRQSQLRGWFTYPSGVDGFALIEVDTPREVATILEPYSRLLDWRIEAISELNYNQTLEELRRSTQAAAIDELTAGIQPAAASTSRANGSHGSH